MPDSIGRPDRPLGEPTNRHRILVRLSPVLAVVAFVWACSEDGPAAPPTPESARPTTVTVSPATAELTAFGATVQLSAEVRDQNVKVMAVWSSADTLVAMVVASGLVTAAGNGTATITLSVEAASGSTVVTVARVANPDRAALVALCEATGGPNWVNSENWLADAPQGEHDPRARRPHPLQARHHAPGGPCAARAVDIGLASRSALIATGAL